jgi:NAD(P)-dependent dehydrogenase (short-subunit alcohol dehydrogenase family)
VDIWEDFEGKTALVTGGASGIGLGIAEAVLEQGGRVVLADIEQARLNEARNVLGERFPGSECDTVLVDVSDRESVARAAEDVRRRFDAVDVLVNNAGVAHNSTSTMDASDQAIDWMFSVNVQGVLNCARAFVPHMIASDRGGRILNTSSIGGFQVRPSPIWFQTLYAATKFAVVALSEGLDIELRPQGIPVSVLGPGGIATDIGTSDRNRPERFGGPTTGSQGPEVARLLAHGLPPITVGRLAVRGMLEGAPYIFVTSRGDIDLVASRHRKIEAAMERWASLLDDAER